MSSLKDLAEAVLRRARNGVPDYAEEDIRGTEQTTIRSMPGHIEINELLKLPRRDRIAVIDTWAERPGSKLRGGYIVFPEQGEPDN